VPCRYDEVNHQTHDFSSLLPHIDTTLVASKAPKSHFSFGTHTIGLYGRGVVLVDLRPAAETAVSYIPGTLLATSDDLLPPYIAVQVMIEGYDPARAVLVVVHTIPLFMVYRLDRSPGAPPPDAPPSTSINSTRVQGAQQSWSKGYARGEERRA